MKPDTIKTLQNIFRNTAFDVDEYGYTDSELIIKSHLLPDILQTTRQQLVADGSLVDTGHTRKNQKGNQEIVWGLCPS
tara:strand:- start:54 stop:287 length:234 start_codon:yes stop_codon:yes gene_type:complete